MGYFSRPTEEEMKRIRKQTGLDYFEVWQDLRDWNWYFQELNENRICIGNKKEIDIKTGLFIEKESKMESEFEFMLKVIEVDAYRKVNLKKPISIIVTHEEPSRENPYKMAWKGVFKIGLSSVTVEESTFTELINEISCKLFRK